MTDLDAEWVPGLYAKYIANINFRHWIWLASDINPVIHPFFTFFCYTVQYFESYKIWVIQLCYKYNQSIKWANPKVGWKPILQCGRWPVATGHWPFEIFRLCWSKSLSNNVKSVENRHNDVQQRQLPPKMCRNHKIQPILPDFFLGRFFPKFPFPVVKSTGNGTDSRSQSQKPFPLKHYPSHHSFPWRTFSDRVRFPTAVCTQF